MILPSSQPLGSLDPIAPLLQDGGVVLLDGGLATELERRGADLNDPLWSARALAENPELIEAVHFDYFEAGANIAISASYQASLEGFADRGLDAIEGRKLLRRSVELAKQARDRFAATGRGRSAPLVAASIGPYGAYLHDGSEYTGSYGLSRRQLVDFHRTRLEALAESAPDLFACETIPCLLEAEALLELLAEFPEVPAWVSFSCTNPKTVAHGELFSECIALVADSKQVVAAGLNCTAPSHVSSLLSTVASAAKPLLVYPNSGETWNAAAHCWEHRPDDVPFARRALEWRRLGARLIGGCCRTTPETIRALANVFDAQPNKL